MTALVLPIEARRAARATLDEFRPRDPCGTKYRPDYPRSAKQSAALSGYANRVRELLYGGSAGSGKSDYLLDAALQYVCVPGYAALLMRQTAPQLTGAEGLIPRSEEWLAGTDAIWHAAHSIFGSNVWEFPSGAILKFGHADRDADRLKFASHAYQYVGFDELTGWMTARPYQYIGFARVRRPAKGRAGLKACPSCGLTLADVPLRTRSGTNPIGPGVPWVKARFQIGLDRLTENPNRVFIPAFLSDNPGIDRDTYVAGLEQGLDPIDLARMLAGDWKISEAGRMFERAWFLQAA
jgi:hypothetical protein